MYQRLTCVGREDVTEDDWHAFSCLKKAKLLDWYPKIVNNVCDSFLGFILLDESLVKSKNRWEKQV